MQFEFLPDVAISDIAFRAYGKTREEVFVNCCRALTSMMASPEKIGTTQKRKISVEGKDDKGLLYSILEELVYIKDVDGLLFKKFKIKINGGKLSAECAGDTLGNIGRENLLNDVKAITMHLFEIKSGKGKWSATVVADI